MRIPHDVVRLIFLISVGWFVLSRPLLRSQGAPAIASTDIMIQRGVPMKTRDGVTLYADSALTFPSGLFHRANRLRQTYGSDRHTTRPDAHRGLVFDRLHADIAGEWFLQLGYIANQKER